MMTKCSQNATDGEKRFYRKLDSNLPEEYVVWQGVEIEGNGKRREVDFLVFHPIYGVWVIEVKDWAASQIRSINQRKWKIAKGRELFSERSPFEQVRENKYIVMNALQKYPELKYSTGGNRGKLKIPIHSFVVFTNISSTDLENDVRQPLRNELENKGAWLKDMLSNEYVGEEEWINKILASRDVNFQSDLSSREINKVKEVFGVPVVFGPSGESIGTLDAHQRKLAEMPFDRHLVIEGPAGSGKSIVLLKRAIFLAKQNPDWRIGVMCFNALMGHYLRTLLRNEAEEEAIRSRIEIWDIFRWANKHIRGMQDFYNEGVNPREAIGKALENSNLNPCYDALLVDEGQDADENLMRLYRAVLKKDGHLTFFYDNRQVLYTDSSIVEQLDNVGFAGPKEKQLVKQQRSVLVLLALAFFESVKSPGEPSDQILQRVLNAAERMFPGIKNWALSLVTGVRRFFKKVFKQDNKEIDWKEELEDRIHLVSASSYSDSIEEVASNIAGKRQTAKDILVLVPRRQEEGVDVIALLKEQLQEQKIPYIYIDRRDGEQFLKGEGSKAGDNRRNADLNANAVKIMTIHTSKGFDAKEVHVLGFDSITTVFPEKIAEVGYVALTRAKEKVYVYYQNEQAISVKSLLSAKRSLLEKKGR